MKAPISSRPTLPPRNHRRRLALAAGICAAAPWLSGRSASAGAATTPLRFGTTPVFLDDQIGLLARWQRYLEQALGRPVVFMQRGSYREVVDLLLNEGVDAAWLCGHPFVLHEARLQLVAVPRYQGAPLYRSHLIVPQDDRATAHIGDLRGSVFAYSDPLSNSGYLVPRTEIIRLGESPAAFFKRSFFTYSHRKVVEAVRTGLAQGGAVDGYVWDTLLLQHPQDAAGVRVAWRSVPHGFPPVVARSSWPAPEREALTSALIGMAESAVGSDLLQRLNIQGFARASPTQFDSIRALLRVHGRPGS